MLDSLTQKPEAVIVQMDDQHLWTPEEIIEVAFRQLMIGFISGDITVDRARYLGRTIGHWALVEETDREVRRQGWFVIRQLTGCDE
jgi:hypothetical protein